MKSIDYRSLVCKLLLSVFIVMISPNNFAFYLAPSDSFIFEGRVFSGKTNISGVSVKIYLINNKVKNILTDRYGIFNVFLKHNQSYIFEMSKLGYITQKIHISTKVSDKVLNEGGIGEAFDNDFEILEYFEGLNTNPFREPIKYFVFSETSFFFEEDTKRSRNVQINEIKKEIVQVKDKIASNELKKGDDFYQQQNYIDATLSYYRVRELKPSREIDNKILDTREKMLKQFMFDGNYADNIKKADELFNLQQYFKAKDKYKRAMAMKPEDPYPANQLILIDSLTSLSYSSDKEVYDKLISVADSFYQDNRLDSALQKYESALSLQVDTIYPRQQIDAIKTALTTADRKKEVGEGDNENLYRGLINQGNEYISMRNYGKALDSFNRALEVKPGDSYALKQIEKVKRLQDAANLQRIKRQKDQDYKNAITRGDKAYQVKDYRQALVHYNSAREIKPSERYPSQRIREIDSIMNQVSAGLLNVEGKDTGIAEKQDTFQLSAEEQLKVDSLLTLAKKYENSGDRSEAANVYMDMAILYRMNGQLKNTLACLGRSYALKKESGDKEGQATVLNNMASVYYDSGQYRRSIETYKQALLIKRRLGDKNGQAELLSELGEVLENTYQYEEASETLLQALDIQQNMDSTKAVSETSEKLGSVYYNQGDYQRAMGYFNKALNIAEASEDRRAEGSLLNSIGVTYYKMGKYDEAVKILDQAVEIDKSIDDKRNLALAYNNIGNVNFNWTRYDRAIEYYQLSLGLKKEMNFENGVAASLYNIGNTYLELKNYPRAKEFLLAALELANKHRFNEVLQLTYRSLSRLYENTNDYKNATNSYKSFISVIGPVMVAEGQYSELAAMYARESRLVRSLRRELERQKFLTDYQTLQTLEKQKELQLKEMELEEHEEQIMQNRIFLALSLFFLVLAGILAFQYRLRYVQKKKFSEVISFQKKEITDSINYASRIQKAVSIPDEQIKKVFPESFIFSRPKSIVSGDYFYMGTKGNKVYVAVADCTGHGVPGAFMSMLGVSLMKEVLWQEKELSANIVLNDLRDACIKALHQTGRDDEAKDGMDVALCVIDPVNMNLEFSGANNPCYIVRNKNLIELKADRNPIGIHPVMESFTTKPMGLEKGDVIYMFSDGFKDQIGEQSLKKYMAKRFSELLINLSAESMNKQVIMLEEAFITWQGNMEQTDDIMVAGIRV